jgi:Spy/CpxP family protein refolding chaperone
MNRISRSALAALPLALAITTWTFAAPDSGKPDDAQRGQHRIERLKEKLGLSDQQAQAVKAAFEKNKDANREVRSQLRDALADYHRAALDGADSKTLAAKSDAAQKMFGKSLELRGTELAEVGKVLTPEQRAEFAKMKEHGHHGRGHGHWKHAGGPPTEDAPEN